MNRRSFAANVLALMTASPLAGIARAEVQEPSRITKADADRSMERAASGPRLQIAMLLYPQFTAQDLIGPHTFLAALMNCDVHLVWKEKQPVPLDRGGAAMLPTKTLDECPRDLDVLFTQGGLEGTIAVMKDDTVLSFLADRGSRAKYVTSVCTGPLILGSAGLLKGYRATSHWAFRELLPSLGATRVDERVVEDRNRITGAGVTSGIDFGLTIAARLRDRTYAEMLQLVNEYDPRPPFHAGTPQQAGPGLTEHLTSGFGPGLTAAREAIASRRPA